MLPPLPPLYYLKIKNMAFEMNTGSTAIKFGSTLGIGYRIYGSISGFTPHTHYPSYNELPYTFSLPSAGVWEIEYTEICPNCSGNKFSIPETAVVTISS